MKLSTIALLISSVAASANAADTKVWKITDLGSGERANLCDRQIQTCQNNCGGPKEALMAFCNTTTMAWGCGCRTKTPDFETWNWPVPAADCRGSNQVCQENCNSQSGDRSACFENCAATHKCNTEDAPVSYTTSADVQTPPQYIGPAVSYKGKELGDLNDGNDRDNLESSSDVPDSSESSDTDSKSTTSSASTLFQSAGFLVVAMISTTMAF
ncbi:hypothetical protein IWW36_005804 [Coemansia brasiliensis]|uniref:DUF7707 domain-containing protein n=1 Tax=Coemansia brasiliensis TaxID=2650707 RepID=A0A9W8I2K4_9FUNG|nr:hypothetical protein IWW36_005804 [Coemansia brasiliensis]